MQPRCPSVSLWLFSSCMSSPPTPFSPVRTQSSLALPQTYYYINQGCGE